MAADFEIWNAPAYRLATRRLVGPWPGDRRIRSEFERVASWANKGGVKTGMWFFRELDGPAVPSKKRRWEMGVEIRTRRPLLGERGISTTVLPRTKVVSVTFDPGRVSPELVYYGLMGWLSWMRRSKEYRQNGPYREVYQGNPWRSKRAWAHTQVQVPIKRVG